MSIKDAIKRILGIYEYDREAEKLIYKSIELFHKGDKFNYWRSIRLYNYIRKNYDCNIYPGITVGNGMYIAHAHGVLIGKTTIIGDNCKFYPNSYVIAAVKDDDIRWKMRQRRHAKIGDDCIIGTGSIIVGPITIGDNVTIGAGALVTKDVPAHTVVKNVNQFRMKTEKEIPDKYKMSIKGVNFSEEI